MNEKNRELFPALESDLKTKGEKYFYNLFKNVGYEVNKLITTDQKICDFYVHDDTTIFFCEVKDINMPQIPEEQNNTYLSRDHTIDSILNKIYDASNQLNIENKEHSHPNVIAFFSENTLIVFDDIVCALTSYYHDDEGNIIGRRKTNRKDKEIWKKEILWKFDMIIYVEKVEKTIKYCYFNDKSKFDMHSIYNRVRNYI